MRAIIKTGAGSAVMHAMAVGGLLLIDPAANEPITIDLTIMPSESMGPGPAGESASGSPSPAPAPVRRTVRARAPTRVPRREERANPVPAATEPSSEIAHPAEMHTAAAAETDSSSSAQGATVAQSNHTGAGTGSPAGSNPLGGTGSGNGVAGAQQVYLAKHFAYIREAIQRSACYPPLARRMGWMGHVVLAFRVLLDGGVTNVRVGKGSGFPLLDSSAVEAVRRASPFPAPPVEAEIVVPVAYVLE